jgi:hypothetical protein
MNYEPKAMNYEIRNEPKTNPILRANYKQMTSKSLTKLFLDTPVDCNFDFQTQRIDASTQIAKISENVCYTNKGLCSLLRGFKCESWKNLKQLSKMEQLSSVIYTFRGNIITIDSLQRTESKVAGLF